MLSYEEHLKKLISLKTAREEVTTWSLSKESQQIEEGHRDKLIPIIIRILISKVKKIKGGSSRKVDMCFFPSEKHSVLILH